MQPANKNEHGVEEESTARLSKARLHRMPTMGKASLLKTKDPPGEDLLEHIKQIKHGVNHTKGLILHAVVGRRFLKTDFGLP